MNGVVKKWRREQTVVRKRGTGQGLIIRKLPMQNRNLVNYLREYPFATAVFLLTKINQRTGFLVSVKTAQRRGILIKEIL